MESKEKQLRFTCPLLSNPLNYSSDSVDLLTDSDARCYWLKCLEGLGHTFVEKARFLNPEDEAAPDKAKKCKESFHELLRNLQENPS